MKIIQTECLVDFLYELRFIEDVPDGIIAAPPSVEKDEAVTGLKPFEKTELRFNIFVLSSELINATSSSLAEPVLLELELTNVVAAAAISCGLDKRKFIPFDELVGIMLNSSPFNAVPKKTI